MIARFKKQEPTAEILSPIFPPELKYVTTLVRTIAASASRIYKPFIELTIQIRTNTRSKQAPRCHSKRTTKINHRSNRATMKNIKTILPTTKLILTNPFKVISASELTVCSFKTSTSNFTLPGLATVTLSPSSNLQPRSALHHIFVNKQILNRASGMYICATISFP